MTDAEFASYPSLRGQVAFISGGATGLGAEFVAQLVAQGVRVGFVDLQVNVRHHFFATQAVVPMMRAAGRGSVINLGSVAAHIDLLDLPAYITAKAGIEGLTRTLARGTAFGSTASSPAG